MSFYKVNDKLQGTLGIISESDPEFESKASPEVRRAVEIAKTARNESEIAKDLKIKLEIRAKYKIEVTFDQHRTPKGPNILGIQLWESGKRFHGGGDELMFFCRDSELDAGCWYPISQNEIKGSIAYCLNCQQAINADRLTNIKIGRVSTKRLADDLVEIFRQLKGDADIYVKFHKTDVRYIAMQRDRGPEIAQRLKGMHIYPLKNILKDLEGGADLSKRFFSFLAS